MKVVNRLTLFALIAFCLSLGSAVMAQDTIEIVFRQGDPPIEIEALTQRIEEWNATNDMQIQVRVETVPWSDALAQYSREAQAGGGPDIIHLGFVMTKDLAINGLLTDLTPFIEADPDAFSNAYTEFLGRDMGEIDGGVYGIPWTVDTFAMAYRPDLFEAAGITEFPQTWEELQTVAAQLTQDTDNNGRVDQYGFCFPAGSGNNGGMWFLVNYYLWSNGKYIIQQNDAGEYEIGVTAEDMAEVMNYYNSFFTSGSTPQSLIAVSSWSDPELVGGLARGDCAIGFHVPASLAVAQSQSDVTLLTHPVPAGSETRIASMGGRVLGINANSQNKDAAWEVIQFLTSAEAYAAYPQFPAQPALLDELEFTEGQMGFVEQLPLAITFSRYVFSPASVNALWNPTNAEFAAFYSGQKTAEQASADLVAAYNQALADGIAAQS
jgi:multiple sugar transport system substrate-binding protein